MHSHQRGFPETRIISTGPPRPGSRNEQPPLSPPPPGTASVRGFDMAWQGPRSQTLQRYGVLTIYLPRQCYAPACYYSPVIWRLVESGTGRDSYHQAYCSHRLLVHLGIGRQRRHSRGLVGRMGGGGRGGGRAAERRTVKGAPGCPMLRTAAR